MKNPLLPTAPLLLPALLLSPPAHAARPARPAPAPPVAAPAALPPLSPSERALIDGVGAHDPPAAEYVFLLETSGAMLDFTRDAREQLAQIVAQVPNGDRVEIVLVHTRYTIALDSVIMTDATRATLPDKIRSLNLLTSKEIDLGAGLAYATSRLDRADAPSLQFLFIAGTFCHDPSINSDYDSGGRGCRPVRGLDAMAKSFREGRKDRVLVTTLFPVGTSTQPVNPDGLAAAKSVFPDATVVDLGATPFPVWARSYAARLPLERILPLVRADAANAGLTVKVLREPTAQKPSAELELNGGTRYLPLKLTGLSVKGAAPGALPTELTLAPTATIEVPLAPPTPPLALFPGEDTIDYPLTLSAAGALEPEAGLASVAIDAARPGLTTTAHGSWHRTYGLPLWLLGLLFAGIATTAGGVALVLRRRFRKVRLGGTFTYRRTGGPRQALEIAELSEAYIVIRPDGELAVGPRSEAVLALRMVKQGLDAYAEAEILSDGIEINRKPTKRGRVRVVPGGTSFQFGEHRLSWE